MLPLTRPGTLALASSGALLGLLPLLMTAYYVELATSALISAMLALSLQLLVGCTGLVSLGHGAFYGLAAYVVYLITPADTGLTILLTLPVAMLTSALAAFVIGAMSLRTRGFFFLMVTLAFGQMIFFVFHDTKLGGGTDGAYLAKPLISAFGYELSLTRRQRPLATYYLAFGQLVLMYFAVAYLLRTLFGRVLEGIRINEHRMQALGFPTYRYKLAVFTLAGMFAGVAGHMWALHRGFVNPELVSWHLSAETLLMILLGGLRTLHGPIIGALAYAGLGELAQFIAESKTPEALGAGSTMLQAIFGRKLLIEGLVILLAVLALPGGLTGARLWRRWGADSAAMPNASINRREYE
jgi:branched-chain amino acid transport system permease protein